MGAGASALSFTGLGGVGGTGGTGGSFRVKGGAGGSCLGVYASPFVISGCGGISFFGNGAISIHSTTGVGNAGQVYGSGGSGSISNNAAAQTGAAGASGIIVITEYI